MPCFSPLKGYRARVVNPSGKRGIVFNPREGLCDRPVDVPCGQCIGCRLERSRQWAVRCMHEAQLHDRNCFLTLTYSPENLPEGGSLVKRDFQLFMKRLRKHAGVRVRFYYCGEYGDRLQRPHYHACIFGFDFCDKTLWSCRDGVKLYRSEVLERLWPLGHSTIGEVTFESAAYCARYITKKVTGGEADGHYGVRIPEFTGMSRRPGIGSNWLEKYSEDVYPADIVVVRGRKCKPPRFYDSRWKSLHPERFAGVERGRRRKAFKGRADSTCERLRVRELCAKAKFNLNKRRFEDEG